MTSKKKPPEESTLPAEVIPTTPAHLDLANPEHVMGFAIKLQDFIQKQGLSTKIQGKQFVQCDGWKFAGINFGVTPIPEEPVNVSEQREMVVYKKMKYDTYAQKDLLKAYLATDNPEQIGTEDAAARFKYREVKPLFKYKCNVGLQRIATGQVIGRGSAICSSMELNKVSWDEYAIASMAQTRAISKAFRNLFGFVMAAAGYQETPAEEIEPEVINQQEQSDPAPQPLPDSVKKRIAGYKTKTGLIDWVNNPKTEKWWDNPDFQEAVKKKIAELEPQKTDKS